MKYTIDRHDNYILFTLHDNKINSLVSPDLKSEFLLQQANGAGNIILDVTEVKYIDSSGLSALLIGNRVFSEAGGLFVMVNPSGHVMKLLQISHLETLLNISPTTENAVEKIKQHVAKQG